ncbi:glucosamine-6-phosphate deaminase [Bacillus sp. FJAT-22090]|uniref:glucosamine-6-phosphate deaminase n=1 Tax=Bacillus sp. FJAT-22090 TaxID=1581038 RepID=UPI00119F92A2|nr:glucosamine-6-phosphate deaminase [Bacillus sp. FJAT-22090]
MAIKLEVIKNLDTLYNHAVDIMADHLKKGSNTFGLATGGTMIPLYKKLRESELDFTNCRSFNLDEYVGIPQDHQESYQSFMKKHLFDSKPFRKTSLPNGEAEDIQKEAYRYEELLNSCIVDFQLLGVGENGHIGFNEPGTAFSSKTHVVELTSSTREANARFFNTLDEVPKKAITMGISSILRANCILLIAVGEKKRAPIEAILKGEITEEIPVTSLCDHPNVIVLTDLSF